MMCYALYIMHPVSFMYIYTIYSVYTLYKYIYTCVYIYIYMYVVNLTYISDFQNHNSALLPGHVPLAAE